jgi:hypothetical protein
VHFRHTQCHEFAAEALDRALHGVPTRTGVHMCYGYSRNIAEKRATPVYAEALALLAGTAWLRSAESTPSRATPRRRRRQDGDLRCSTSAQARGDRRGRARRGRPFQVLNSKSAWLWQACGSCRPTAAAHAMEQRRCSRRSRRRRSSRQGTGCLRTQTPGAIVGQPGGTACGQEAAGGSLNPTDAAARLVPQPPSVPVSARLSAPRHACARRNLPRPAPPAGS